jgi:formylmethanofuran dehydrogenase subunit B
MSAQTVANVTCLGCGCACDDLRIGLSGGRIASVEPPCPLARAWFGDGSASDRVLAGGRAVSESDAVAAAAELLAGSAGRALVYVGTDLSSQAQRAAIGIADLLRASVDGPTSAPAAAGLLAAQRRGRAGATLGEIRNRADVVLCWAVDPSDRYPRWLERYAPSRPGRELISVSIGADRGPAGAAQSARLGADQEITGLSVLRAAALGNKLGDLPGPLAAVAAIGARLVAAKYVAVVHDAEPALETGRDPLRAEGLIALTQALNGPTRAAMVSLRAGGNRSGLESALTWQTGYPMAVSFAGGVPCYEPSRRAVERPGAFGAALVIGGAGDIAGLDRIPSVAIGPRASEAGFKPKVAIDTGVAGIHESGYAYRMDEVPLPLTPPLPGARTVVATLENLLAALAGRVRRAG